jgi:hypothetical protein
MHKKGAYTYVILKKKKKVIIFKIIKMGKEKPGFLTPKAIANRIKSKGLQKLRWYCQMCEKQCRDEVRSILMK